MQLNVIGTGSSGNAYILSAGGAHGQSLLLDAGVSIREIARHDAFRDIQACLITHEHGDHAKSAGHVSIRGIPTYATQGTIEAIRAANELARYNVARPLESIKIGDFTILPFETQHDAAEPCGYLIRYDPTGETALYATDTYYIKYTFPNVNYWIIECNYVDEIMNGQMADGEIDGNLRNRLVKSHMSLKRCCDMLKANDLTETRAIVLVHLSGERSDQKRMIKTVREATGIADVVAAQNGETYNLEMTPF